MTGGKGRTFAALPALPLWRLLARAPAHPTLADYTAVRVGEPGGAFYGRVCVVRALPAASFLLIQIQFSYIAA